MFEGVDKGENYYLYVFGERDGIFKIFEWVEKIIGVN